MKKTWTSEETMFLKENYEKFGADYCSNKLNRSKVSITKKAFNLNLFFISENKWTLIDIEFLKTNYKKFGVKYCAEKLKRTLISTRKKALSLNFRMDPVWNNDDEKFLKENYGKFGVKYCAEKLNKTPVSISKKAARLNLQIAPTWSNEDDNFLKENYPKFGPTYCSEKLNKNYHGLIKHARFIGLVMDSKWTKEQEEFLKENYEKMGIDYCAEKLKRSTCAVGARFTKLNNLLDKSLKKSDTLWGEEEDKFLKENFPIYEKEYCSEKLNRSVCAILARSRVLNLKITNEKLITLNRKKKGKNISDGILKSYDERNNNKNAVNPEQFFTIKTKEVAYILGLIWADGHVRKYKNHNSIQIQMLKKDLETIEYVFNKTGRWCRYERAAKGIRQSQLSLVTNNRKLVDFLLENDYGVKSYVSPEKILSKIPENLKHYFYRGFFDGDGCFYYSEKNNTRTADIASTYTQDWSYMENLFSKLDIKYKINRTIRENGNKYSKIRIWGLTSLQKWGDFIYLNYSKEKMGLLRKYNKWIEAKTPKNSKFIQK